MTDNNGWNPQVDDGANGVQSSYDPTQVATDVYRQLTAQAGGAALPLVLLGLPSHTGTKVTLISAPGNGAVVKSYYGASVDATFPGDDLYIELHADMEWHLPLTAATQTSDNSLIKFTDSGHVHSVTVSDGSHTHAVGGATSAASAGASYQVPSNTHTHKFLTRNSDQFVDNPTPQFWVDAGGNELNVASGSHGGVGTQMFTAATGAWATGNVSDVSHTHTVSAQTAGAVTSGFAISTTSVVSGLVATLHKHIISPTTASIRATMALVIDGTIVTSGLINGNLFQAGGFTGTDGIIHMANVFILKKDASTVNLLRGGHHKVGLYFSITVTDWGSGVAQFNNPSFSIRNAGNDARVKVYTP